MRKSLLGVVLAATLLPVSLVHAGIPEDLSANRPVYDIIAQAKAERQDITSVLGQIFTAAPDKAYEALAAAMALYPEQIDTLSSFAVSRGLDRNAVNTIASTTRSGGLFAGINAGGFNGGVMVQTAINGSMTNGGSVSPN